MHSHACDSVNSTIYELDNQQHLEDVYSLHTTLPRVIERATHTREWLCVSCWSVLLIRLKLQNGVILCVLSLQ